MADELNVSASMIYSLERDPVTPNLELAYRIAHYFDMAVEQVFEPVFNDRLSAA
jgi:DNA-binding XRE family transcriptional regulator